jgi:hypothetical protein
VISVRVSSWATAEAELSRFQNRAKRARFVSRARNGSDGIVFALAAGIATHGSAARTANLDN